jgi:hypothetical protein
MLRAFGIVIFLAWFLFASTASYLTAPPPPKTAPNAALEPLDPDICMRLAQLHLSMDGLRKVKDDVTSDDVRAALARIAEAEVDAYNNVSDRVGNVSLDELKDAFDKLSLVINALPPGLPIGEATEALREPAAALARAENTLRLRLRCG